MLLLLIIVVITIVQGKLQLAFDLLNEEYMRLEDSGDPRMLIHEMHEVSMNLAAVLFSLGRHDEAHSFFEKCYEFERKVHGPESSTCVILHCNMALSLLHMNGRVEEGISILQTVFAWHESNGFNNMQSSLVCGRHLATHLRGQCKYREQKPVSLKTLQICESYLGVNHVQTYEICLELAIACEGLNEIEDARDYCMRAVDGWAKAYGEQHVNTITGRNMLQKLAVFTFFSKYNK